MPSKKKSSKTQPRLSNSEQFNSPLTTPSHSSTTEAREDELRCYLEEASKKYPFLVGKSAFIGQITEAETNASKGCKIWLSEPTMVASAISPGSIVSVSLAPLRKNLSDGFSLSSLVDECGRNLGIESREEGSDEAGSYFALATVFPSNKVLKNGVRLSSNLSYTLGCPSSGRTVFVYPFQSHTFKDVLNWSGQSVNARVKQVPLYRCKTLYLELATARTLRVNCNTLPFGSLNRGKSCDQIERGLESSPKTPLYQSKISSPVSSQLTSPKSEDSFSSFTNPIGLSLGTFNITEVLVDESAKKILQTCAISWLCSRCVLSGNLVVIPILSELCIFHVKNADRVIENQTSHDLVNGGSQGVCHEVSASFEDLNYAFIINPETEVKFSLPSNLSYETPKKQAVPAVKLEYRDTRVSTETVVPKLGGLSKEYAELKGIIASSLKNTLSSFGLRTTKGVLLHGPPGTGKTSLAHICAHDTGVNLFSVNGPEIVSQYYGESEQALHNVFEAAGKAAPAVVFIDELDAIAPARKEGSEELSQRMVATLLNLMDGISRSDGLLVIAATNRPDFIEPALRRPGRLDREIELGVPSPNQRLDILHTLLCEKEHSLSDKQVKQLAMVTHGFVGADLAALCNEAALVCLKRYTMLKKPCPESRSRFFLAYEDGLKNVMEGSFITKDAGDLPRDITSLSLVDSTASSETIAYIRPEEAHSDEDSTKYGVTTKINESSSVEECMLKITLEDFGKARMKVRPSAMREVVLEVPKVNWEDVGGQKEVKTQLMEAVLWPQKHQDAFKRIGIRPPTGVLMFGPPGCSKTLMARAVASEAGLNFLAVKGPELFSKWVGESEKAVRSLFAKARANAPSIIFFDEIDGLAVVRGKDSDGASVADRVMSQLLVELDGLHQRVDVTVIAATNRPDKIDPALLRPGRFDRLLYVGPPNEIDREDIFRIHLQKIPCNSNIKITELACLTEGFTGADISLICREAALAAMQESLDASEITMEHLKASITKVEPSDIHSFQELSARFQRLVSSGAVKDVLVNQQRPRQSNGFCLWATMKSVLTSLYQVLATSWGSKRAVTG